MQSGHTPLSHGVEDLYTREITTEAFRLCLSYDTFQDMLDMSDEEAIRGAREQATQHVMDSPPGPTSCHLETQITEKPLSVSRFASACVL